MPLSMKGYGRKNPSGREDGEIAGRRDISQNSDGAFTYIFEDDDPGTAGISSDIGTPSLNSSGVQLYSMDFTLEDQPGGIDKAVVKRIADTERDGSTYLTYQVTLSLNPNSSQKSITLGAPALPNAEVYSDFYFSNLGINEGIAIAGSGNVVGTLYRDCLNGSDRDDILDGVGGIDYLRGGNGNDTYIVYDVDTQIEEAPQTGIETVISYVDWSLNQKVKSPYGTGFSSIETATGLDHLILRGAALNGTGNELNNTIEGNANNNTLIGGLGNDTLTGNEGSDVLNGFGTVASSVAQIDSLIGGAGSDYFVLGGEWGVSYVEPGDGYAVIKDWNALEDWIQVRNIGSYSLDSSKSISGIGDGSKNDTEIYFTDASGNRDRIAVIVDSVNIEIGRNFKFV